MTDHEYLEHEAHADGTVLTTYDPSSYAIKDADAVWAVVAGKIKLRVKIIGPFVGLPSYATAGSSGLDLHTPEGFVLMPGEVRRVPLGIAIEIPFGYEGQIRPRSGLSARGLHVALGTIDSDYRGELRVVVANINWAGPIQILARDRIAQLVIAPVARVEVIEASELGVSSRGTGGFGSTGR